MDTRSPTKAPSPCYAWEELRWESKVESEVQKPFLEAVKSACRKSLLTKGKARREILTRAKHGHRSRGTVGSLEVACGSWKYKNTSGWELRCRESWDVWSFV